MSNQSKPDETGASPAAETDSPRYPTALKICHNPNCGFSSRDLHRCPKCGRPMQTTADFRIISLLLVCCGGALATIGGGLIFVTSGYKGSEFEGGEPVQIFLFGIFGVILSFGLSVTAAGLWQVIFGRANQKLIYLLLGFMLALLVIAGVARLVLLLLSS